MIHLDTNYSIRLLVSGSPQALRGDQWLASGESLAANALAWTELLNGPVLAPHVALVESVIGSRVVPFDGATAAVAVGLFNQAGRGRGARLDCLNAAAVIRDQADLATANQKDFAAFVPSGLRLLLDRGHLHGAHHRYVSWREPCAPCQWPPPCRARCFREAPSA